METVYVETTVIGHLAGRSHPDPLISARQQFARIWWPKAISRYQLVISQIVRDECAAGDPEAASERLAKIQSLETLAINAEARALAGDLIARHAVPATEPRDAFHVALAAVHSVQYLVSWNFKHIVQAAARARIERVCRALGFVSPIICTPEELMVEDDENSNGRN